MTENLAHGLQATLADDGVALSTCRSRTDRDDATVARKGAASGKVKFFEALNRAGRRRRINAQRLSQVTHTPTFALDEKIERVDLARIERRVTFPEQLVAQAVGDRATTQLAPGETDTCKNVYVGNVRLGGHRNRLIECSGVTAHVPNASETHLPSRIAVPRIPLSTVELFTNKGRFMKVHRFPLALRFSVVCASIICAVGVPAVGATAASPLPVGVGDFVPTVDLGPALADLAGLSSTPCNVGSSNITELKRGDTLTLPASDLSKALAVAEELKSKKDSLVALTCTATLSLSGAERSVAGTVTNAALGLTGTFALACTFKQELGIQADLSIGLALPRGALVAVKSADRGVPMTCSMSANFGDGTSVTGSVDGIADVGTTRSDACTGDTQMSCVPLSVTAAVTITSTTGKLAGYTGKGTYTLKPSFTMNSMNSNLAILQQAIGKSSVRASRVAPGAASKEGTMKIDFVPGGTRIDIVQPSVAIDGSSKLSVGSLVAANGPRKAKCTYSVARGKKSALITSVTSSTNGVMPTHTISKKLYDSARKTLGVKPGSQLSLVIACGKTRATQAVTLG